MIRSRHFPALLFAALASMAVAGPASTGETPTGIRIHRLALGLDLTRGNSDTLLTTGRMTSDILRPTYESRAGMEFSFGKSEGEKTQENGKGHAQFNSFLSPRNYLYAGAELSRDKIAEIEYRFLGGPGLGRYWSRNKQQSFSTELGAAYRRERTRFVIETPDGPRHDATTEHDFPVRAAQRYESSVGESSRIWESAEYLPTTDDLRSYLLNAEIGMDVRINTRMDLRVMIEEKHNSDPAPDAEKDDLAMKVSLVFRDERP